MREVFFSGVALFDALTSDVRERTPKAQEERVGCFSHLSRVSWLTGQEVLPTTRVLQSASMLERRSFSWPAAATLFLILVVAGLLRFWGIDYGLPHPTSRPDEERIVGRAFAILSTGRFHPGDFTYPGLLKYLNALALAFYYGVGKLIGHYQELFDFQIRGCRNAAGPPLSYLSVGERSTRCGHRRGHLRTWPSSLPKSLDRIGSGSHPR